MRTPPADNGGELAFVVDALGIRREYDRLIRTGDGGRRLKKKERLLGDNVAKFGDVINIIATDTDDFAGFDRSKQARFRARPTARGARPLAPRGARDFANLLALDCAVERRSSC